MFKGKSVRALGTMSGTSMDGVDAAVLVTDGLTIDSFEEVEYRAYSDAERALLRGAMGLWPDNDIAKAAELVETAHAQLLTRFAPVDLIGFHGQTIAHDPGGRGTHQLGDGQILAEVLQTPVVWDFRSADVRLGGQGAPLAPFFHHALARWIGFSDPVCFLNLGGVGNITWVDPRLEQPETAGALLAFDTGPANAPINDAMNARLERPFDDNGALAAQGTPDTKILEGFMAAGFFHKIPPKSLDRNDFAALSEAVAPLSDEDAIATLTAAVALSVEDGFQHLPSLPKAVLVTGGGRHNDTMMKMLAATLPCSVLPVEAHGLNGDMLEAQAFAYLAVRVANGLPTSCPGTTGVKAAVCGGTLSRPLANNAALEPDQRRISGQPNPEEPV